MNWYLIGIKLQLKNPYFGAQNGPKIPFPVITAQKHTVTIENRI